MFDQFGLVTLGMSLGLVLKVENCEPCLFGLGSDKTKIPDPDPSFPH